MNVHTVVVPFSDEPGTDMYWHPWIVVQVARTEEFDKRDAEKVVESVNKADDAYQDYTYDEKDNEIENKDALENYLLAVCAAFADAGYAVKFSSFARLAFPGDR